MSASDLAPFVAAVLNDRTVAGLIQENNELKSELTDRDNERLLVEVTGQDGSPIYNKGSMRNARRFGIHQPIYYKGYMRNGRRFDADEIVLDFDNDGRDGFPLSSLTGIEIRVGGVVVERSIIDHLIICFDNDHLYDEENRMHYITLDYSEGRHLYGPIASVDGVIGPLPLGERHVDRAMVLTEFLELVADENNDLTPQTLIIEKLFFREKDITGIMSLINIRDMT